MIDTHMADLDPRVDTARRNIRMAVALRDTNMAEAARQAGLSRNAISQFVAGRTTLSYSNTLRVCDVLGIPIGILHQPDAITENRIRLHRLLERMPDHLSAPALKAALEAAGRLSPPDPDQASPPDDRKAAPGPTPKDRA